MVCLQRRDRRNALQRLCSTFPGGAPGIGLLLLRVAVGVAAVAVGAQYLRGSSGPTWAKWLLGPLLTTSGAALAIGFLTPYGGLLVGLSFLGIALSWFPTPSWGLHDVRLIALGIIITGVVITLLGPGAFSLDSRLFGRRQIIIPPSSHRSTE